ncbi:hypothetical protein AAHB94_31215 [Bacillus toyonensis]
MRNEKIEHEKLLERLSPREREELEKLKKKQWRNRRVSFNI